MSLFFWSELSRSQLASRDVVVIFLVDINHDEWKELSKTMFEALADLMMLLDRVIRCIFVIIFSLVVVACRRESLVKLRPLLVILALASSFSSMMTTWYVLCFLVVVMVVVVVVVVVAFSNTKVFFLRVHMAFFNSPSFN
jgi:magnesium-transporting ATPase (P-type)